MNRRAAARTVTWGPAVSPAPRNAAVLNFVGEVAQRLADKYAFSGGRSGNLRSSLDQYFDVEVEREEDGARMTVRWYHSRNIEHWLELPSLLFRPPEACAMGAAFRPGKLDIIVSLRCPAYDLFAIELKERLEEALKGELGRALDEPLWSADFTDELQMDTDLWQWVLNDTSRFRTPSGSYRRPIPEVRKTATDFIERHQRLERIDRDSMALLGHLAIRPAVTIRIREEYAPKTSNEGHLDRYHRTR